jgi:hypothetical protein
VKEKENNYVFAKIKKFFRRRKEFCQNGKEEKEGCTQESQERQQKEETIATATDINLISKMGSRQRR